MHTYPHTCTYTWQAQHPPMLHRGLTGFSATNLNNLNLAQQGGMVPALWGLACLGGGMQLRPGVQVSILRLYVCFVCLYVDVYSTLGDRLPWWGNAVTPRRLSKCMCVFCICMFMCIALWGSACLGGGCMVHLFFRAKPSLAAHGCHASEYDIRLMQYTHIYAY
jgi:hypothetical protein